MPCLVAFPIPPMKLLRPLSFSRGYRRAGFSLIEVTLAIGIVAFAFISLFGLVPTGLNVFRASIDTTIGTQIVQEVTDIAQQTDYPTLTNNNSASTYLPANGYWFYDEQGNQITDKGVPVTDSTNALAKASVYTVRTTVRTPSVVPAMNSSLDPGTNGTPVTTTSNVATLQIQIAKNPGHDPNPFSSTRNIPVSSYTAYVARNLGAFIDTTASNPTNP